MDDAPAAKRSDTLAEAIGPVGEGDWASSVALGWTVGSASARLVAANWPPSGTAGWTRYWLLEGMCAALPATRHRWAHAPASTVRAAWRYP